MATDPGDLVLDPTCGSGTTACVAEQWGRRWITIDTSRVALALARARVMGARYPYYLLADSPEGQRKEGEIIGKRRRKGNTPSGRPGLARRGVEAARGVVGCTDRPPEGIDASIAAKAEFEYLNDKPCADPSRIRVSGPFTVESLSPHRVLAIDADDSLIDTLDLAEKGAEWGEGTPDFAHMVLENHKTAGVQQAHKEDRITFTSLAPWPGELICAEGRYMEGDQERRAAIFLGPEFGTVPRADLIVAAREAAELDFNVVVACAFNFDVHSTELDRLGRIPILKARMNPDLDMADSLKTTASGNLFVVFGEPDIEIEPTGYNQIRVRIKGADVFHPQTGEVESGWPPSLCGLSTRTTMRKAFSSATPISSARRPILIQSIENYAESRD
jgi:hypothetical protein